MINRWDETWHRLREWTKGQAPSERLAAQLLLHEGYKDLDPSHPLGGKDGGKDAVCFKNGNKWIMAVYFPRGQQDFEAIKTKFLDDLKGVAANQAVGIAFVTNQELRLAERPILQEAAKPVDVDLFHLERITTILDKPELVSIRKQFLEIDFSDDVLRQEVSSVKDEIKRLQGVQTGGDSFCYWMLYHFDLLKSVAHNFVVIRHGDFPLYDVRLRIMDMDANKNILERLWGEINAPSDFLMLDWPLPKEIYYRVFFHARNGNWVQDLILKRSSLVECWLAATRLKRGAGEIILQHIDDGFENEFGLPEWRD